MDFRRACRPEYKSQTLICLIFNTTETGDKFRMTLVSHYFSHGKLNLTYISFIYLINYTLLHIINKTNHINL